MRSAEEPGHWEESKESKGKRTERACPLTQRTKIIVSGERREGAECRKNTRNSVKGGKNPRGFFEVLSQIGSKPITGKKKGTRNLQEGKGEGGESNCCGGCEPIFRRATKKGMRGGRGSRWAGRGGEGGTLSRGARGSLIGKHVWGRPSRVEQSE